MLELSDELVNRLVLFLTHSVKNGCRLRHIFVRNVSLVWKLEMPISSLTTLQRDCCPARSVEVVE